MTDQIPRRFCAIYTANGMSLPKAEHGISEWSWFPPKGANGEFEFGKSTEPLAPFRKQLSFMGGMLSPERSEGRPACLLGHVADGRAAAQSQAGNLQFRRPRSGDRAAHQAVLPAAFPGAFDRCRNGIPLAHRHDLLQPGRPADSGGEQSAARVRPVVPRRPDVATSGARETAAADQAGGCRGGERAVARPAIGRDRPREDGPVHDLARRGGVAAGRIREVDRHSAEEAGLLAPESGRHQRGRSRPSITGTCST